MTAGKHTPGDWRIVEREVFEDGSVFPRHIVGGARELTICYLEAPEVARLAVQQPHSVYANDAMMEAEGDIRSKKANARLIEAAPDMLVEGSALVKQVRAALPHLNGQAYSSLLSQVNAFEAVITKAEGGAS